MALDRSWYNALVDDDGSGMTGSVWDKADVDALMDAVDAEIVRVQPGNTICVLTNGSPIPWGTGVWATFPFQTEWLDPLNMHAPNDSFVYLPAAGYYLFHACASWPPSNIGSRGIAPYVSGAWIRGELLFGKAFDGGGTIGLTLQATTLLYTNAPGVPVGVQLFQDSGTSQTLPTNSVRLEVSKLAP